VAQVSLARARPPACAFRASLHGVVSLTLPCPGFPATSDEIPVPALVKHLL
jgi:hypothetical protein